MCPRHFVILVFVRRSFSWTERKSTFVLEGGLQYVVHGQTVFDQRNGIREALLRATVACWSGVTSLRLLGQSAPFALRGTHRSQRALRLLLLPLLPGQRTGGGDWRRWPGAFGENLQELFLASVLAVQAVVQARHFQSRLGEVPLQLRLLLQQCRLFTRLGGTFSSQVKKSRGHVPKTPPLEGSGGYKEPTRTYESFDIALELLYAVHFSLAAALRSGAVFASPANVVDKLELLLTQLVVLQELLEGFPTQRWDLLHWKRELHL